MDPITLAAAGALATQVVKILTPLVQRVGDGFLDKVGEDFHDAAQHVYKLVHDHFAKQPDHGKASTALQNFDTDPVLYSPVLHTVLQQSLTSDPQFASVLRAALQRGPLQEQLVGEGAEASGNEFENTLGQGTQRQVVDKNARANKNKFKIE